MAMQPRGQELVERYRANYRIRSDDLIAEEMVLGHWELERRLAREILDSRPEERWEVVVRCYTALYKELEWLNRITGSALEGRSGRVPEYWSCIVGGPPKRVYEVGSGWGELIHWLAERGHFCRGSEITTERGKRWVNAHENLSWGITDGVHLDRFEPAESFDVVISDQVVEHLHPDDLVEHFRGVYALLVPGGRYLMATPHVHVGPTDISAVFRLNKPEGLHLKEYSYREIVVGLREAGFPRVDAVVPLPVRLHRAIAAAGRLGVNRGWLGYYLVAEMLLAWIPGMSLRRKVTRLAGKVALFRRDLVCIATKGTS